MKFTKYILLLLLVSSCGQSGGQTKSQTPHIRKIAVEKNIKLPSLPWHMMQVIWNFKDSIPDFKRYDIDVTISNDVPETYNLYISVINSAFNNAGFYGGIQTNINGWKNKEDRTRVHPGKGAIFSRWSVGKETPIGLEYVDKFEDGLCESAGYEGEFCSVRRPFKWTKGTYTVSLTKEETITHKNSPHTWVAMEVTNKKTNEVQKVGRLLFEGETLQMRNSHMAAFVEIYSTTKIRHSSVPEVTVTFGYPKINGKNLQLENVYARQENQGIASSPNCASVISEGTDVSVTITSDVKPHSENNIIHYIMLQHEK